MMKKFNTLWMALCTVVAAATLTSCDEDLSRSVTLSGEWRGDFGMFYDYEYYGRVYTFDSYDTRIVFYPDHDYATYGYGKEVDYYEQGPYAYQYYRFRWYMDRGNLYLEYPYDPSLNTVIRDYHMSSSSFYGYFGDTSNRFYLRKIADYYDWGYYNGDYLYDPRGDWYGSYGGYVKQEVAPADTLDHGTVLRAGGDAEGQGTIVRRGNRFAPTR